ncbi:MAG: ABC transporter substrate-binding protein, partial [Eubacteriales bacterium]|nr:ABC transporter substrate-binding protein [Eubacteriales bacterium]
GLGFSRSQAPDNHMEAVETPFSLGLSLKEREAELASQRERLLPQLKRQLVGTFRYPMIQAEAYQPYLVRNDYDLAMNKLLFRSLFSYDIDGAITADLVTALSFSTDQRIVEISLRDDAFFADRSLISATDVKAAIDYLISDNDFSSERYSQGYYNPDLAAIESCEVIDPYGLRIFLNKADPFIAHALTFPILKYDQVELRGIDKFTLSKPFHEPKRSESGNLLFELIDKTENQGLAHIGSYEIISYANEGDLTKAFEKDEIDMIFAFTGQLQWAEKRHFVYKLDRGVALRNLNVNADNLADVRTLREAFSTLYQNRRIFRPIDPALSTQGYPVSQKAISSLIFPESANYRVRRKPGTKLPEIQRTELKLIYPNTLLFADEIAEAIKQYAEPLACKIKIESMNEDEFYQALQYPNVDLALLPINFHRSPDPRAFFSASNGDAFWRDNHINPVLEADFLDKNLASDQIDLFKDYTLANGIYSPMEDPAFVELYLSCIQNLSDMPLAGYTTAVYLQDRVRGKLSSNSLNPLEGIENLWIENDRES